MPRGMNKVMLIGNVGGDPVVKYTAAGVAFCSFSLATSEKWNDKDGNSVDKTEWHKIVAFKRLAEIIGEFVKKGSRIYVEGRIQTRKWQDQEGADHYVTEIVASDMLMTDAGSPRGTSDRAPAASSKPPAQNGQSGFRKPAESAPGYPEDFQDDPDIPF